MLGMALRRLVERPCVVQAYPMLLEQARHLDIS